MKLIKKRSPSFGEPLITLETFVKYDSKKSEYFTWNCTAAVIITR